MPVQLQATVEPAVTDTDAGEKAKPRGSPTTVTDALRGARAGVGVAGGGCGAVVAVAIAATVGGTVAIVAAGVGTVGIAEDARVGTVPADADADGVAPAALADATLPVAGDAVVEAAGAAVCDFSAAGCDAAGAEVGSWPFVFEDPPPQLKARQAQAIATTLANLPFLRNPCGEPQRMILGGGDCCCC